MAATATVVDLFAADASDELAAALDSVEQASSAGAPKYHPAITRALRRTIVCRSYGTAIFELVHLVAAGTAIAEAGYESLFWGHGTADAARFRGAFGLAARDAGSLPPWLAVDAAGIRIATGDGAFRVAYSRMPFLAALMDFLVATIGYASVDDQVAAFGQRPPARDALKGAANAIARALYGYLSRHLAPLQSQRKFRRILSFLAARGSRPLEPDAVDDDAVLGFWCEASGSGDADWKTFRAAFASFVHFRAALLAASTRRAMRAARPLGLDRAAGEVDPADVDRTVMGIAEHGAALEELCDGRASPVKFLTRRERESLRLMMEAGDTVAVLPLSLLRADLFGAAQARITQSLRCGMSGDAAVGAALSGEGEGHGGYGTRRRELAQQSARLEQLLLAAFFVLAGARRGEAITIMLGLRPGIDLRAMASAVEAGACDARGPAVGGGIAGLRERFFLALLGPGHPCPSLTDFMGEARDACRRVSRKGFAAADRDRPAVIDAMAAGADPLFRIRDTLGRYLGALDRALPTPERAGERHARDRDIFLAQFRILYGGRP